MLKPFKTWSFVCNCVVLLFSAVFWAGVYVCMLGLDSSSPCSQVVSLNELQQVTYATGETVALADYQPFGESFQPFEDRKDDYQLLVGSNVDLADADRLTEKDFVLAFHGSNNQTRPDLAAALKDNRSGNWYLPKASDPESTSDELDDEDEKDEQDGMADFAEAFGSKFPDLDYRKIRTAIPWSAVMVYKKHLKDEAWLAKLDDDRTDVYRQHQHAMRLVGATEYWAENGPIERPMDVEFDVSLSKEVKRPKLRRWTWIIVAAFVLGGLGGLAQFYYMNSSFGVDFLGEWAQVIAMVLIGGGVHALIHVIGQKNGAGRQELALEPGTLWTRFRESAFYQYHDRVLNELGFVTVGHYRLSGSHVPVARTIYLSQRGNVLVELGVESGKEFFTIETVTNNEKFLETHSLCPPSKEKTDIYQRHLRNSASHEDIVQALEEHDAHVGKYVGSGYREAMFTEERFPRFLEWVSRTPKEDDKLKELGSHRNSVIGTSGSSEA